ncbi:c-type cytochrome [Parafilimonas sp.]|uniref:c-type cytochrome n=1 Tax=Parafilimonas sp. TaxID=1969739 RepID=UPI0039E469D3
MFKLRRLTTITALKKYLFLIVSFSFSVSSFAQDGKALFTANCASCHAINKKLTGPALAGVEDRWPSRDKIHDWVHNSAKVIQSGDPYAVNLFNEFNKTQMTAFPQLSAKDIDAILDYIKTEAGKATAAAATPAAGTETTEDNSDQTLIFGVLTLILAIVAFTLLYINANLKKMADDKEGIPAMEPIPFWRNKAYITIFTLVLFLIGGYLITEGAVGLGRQQKYEPRQPIFFSHKVHPGVNQINCQYCHIGVYQGKQATIPSVNICMNCHMAINEYKGETLYDAEGNEVNGTAEIQKLYKYAGFEPGKPWDASKAKPIEWVRIHNLPDHVYFNHSQHVNAGRVQCQTCHGEVTSYNEMFQFAPLSMGWCINCHRTTKVQFNENGFYSMYEKYKEDIKNHRMDSVTVKDIGGAECQKCHY